MGRKSRLAFSAHTEPSNRRSAGRYGVLAYLSGACGVEVLYNQVAVSSRANTHTHTLSLSFALLAVLTALSNQIHGSSLFFFHLGSFFFLHSIDLSKGNHHLVTVRCRDQSCFKKRKLAAVSLPVILAPVFFSRRPRMKKESSQCRNPQSPNPNYIKHFLFSSPNFAIARRKSQLVFQTLSRHFFHRLSSPTRHWPRLGLR